jgi:hypothetical protein
MNTMNPSRAANVPQIIQDKIQRYHRRFKLLALAEGAAETLAVFLALLTVNLLLDWFVPMSLAARAALVIATWLVCADGRPVVLEMERKTETAFAATLRGVRSDAHTVTAWRGPQIESLKISCACPEFTRLKPRVEVSRDGDIAAPAGTAVTVEAVFDRDIAEAWLLPAGAKPQPLAPQAARTALAQFTVGKDATYQIGAADERGYTTSDRTVLRIKAQPNAAPVVSLSEPASDLLLLRPVPVRLAYTARDDYGVTSLRLVWEIAGQFARGNAELPLAAHAPTSTAGAHVWDIASAGIASGDRVSFWLEAEDETADGTANRAVSAKARLQISGDAEFSILTPEFEGAKRLVESSQLTAQHAAHLAEESARLRAEFARRNMRSGEPTTRRESARAASSAVNRHASTAAAIFVTRPELAICSPFIAPSKSGASVTRKYSSRYETNSFNFSMRAEERMKKRESVNLEERA